MIFYGIELAIGTDIKSLVVEGGTTIPTTNLAAGRLFYNITNNSIYFYNGSAWKIIGGGNNTFVNSFNGRSGVVTLLTTDLPIATTATVGGVRIGTGLYMNGNVLSANAPPEPITEIPAGSRLLWAQPSAPTGWTQDNSFHNRMLRVVAGVGSTGSGGTGGYGYDGVDNPIYNDKVPNHAHHFDVNSSGAGAHAHTITNIRDMFSFPSIYGGPNAGYGDEQREGISYSDTSAVGNHAHNVAGDTWGVAGAGTWSPMYLNLILCFRQ